VRKIFVLILAGVTINVTALTGLTFAQEYLVKSGDTMQGIFSEQLDNNLINQLLKDIRKTYPGFVLKAGETIILNDNSAIISPEKYKDIIIEFKNDNYSLKEQKAEIVTMQTLVSGVILTNLFDTISDIGEDIELAAMLASIYEWEIDFFRDLRIGDKFDILVEKRFVNNKYAGYGKILAVDFRVAGKHKRAVYYENGNLTGYYNPNGVAFERGFLRVPLSFTRISSRFSHSRLHPVHYEYRPHYGVDYAAPRGTPVFATAAGIIEKRERTAGNGNFVLINHNNGYRTYYLHLDRFNSILKRGSKVKRGQIIGYVGNTGISTGYHLDYRIKFKNKWLNPLKMRILPTKKISKELFAEFEEEIEYNLNTVKNAGVLFASSERDLRMLPY